MVQINHTCVPKFIPTTKEELIKLGWDQLDVVLVSGDTYIDAPHMGVVIVGKMLLQAGFRVGLIAQPKIDSDKDITRLGEPTLFWGVTSGCVDSMVANYTASGKRRKSDDLTPGGRNTLRPDRAVIVYTNLIRRDLKSTKPIVLGGIEASLRRISHYDAWSNSIRRSILFDAKADLLVYGMAEKAIVELTRCLKKGQNIQTIKGICYISKQIPEPTQNFPDPAVILPDHKAAQKNPSQFIQMFRLFYANTDPLTAKQLCQKQDTRYLIQNPPQPYVTQQELDQIHELPFTRTVHPFYSQNGQVKALETIQFSLISHRGCFGECRFCAIAVHQGRRVISRSKKSILEEAAGFTAHFDFKGIISDVGGPTANMYASKCSRKQAQSVCTHKSCLYPNTCKKLTVDHQLQIKLLRDLRKLPGVRKVFIGSGLRYDLILADKTSGTRYLEEILRHHVSGQLKIAPEHSQKSVLDLMGKSDLNQLLDFIVLFEQLKHKTKRNVFLTYYLMAAHPGCTLDDMRALKHFARKELHLLPKQIQIFTPTPSTWATVMYHTGMNPFTGKSIFVEKTSHKKVRQKAVLAAKQRH